MAKVVRLTENDIERMVKKIIKEQSLNENMSLGNYPYINADDDELGFIIEDNLEEEGKIEIHGNQVYYDENDEDAMEIMLELFPNEFDEDNRQIGFGNPREYDEDEEDEGYEWEDE